MKNVTSLFFALAVGSTVLSAQTAAPANPAQRGNAARDRANVHPIARVMDLDKNGELSPAEIANASTMIYALDVDGDGTVSFAELRPARPVNVSSSNAGRTRPIESIMLALDANGDGEVSMAEIANAATSLASLDANKDGKLTRNELRPAPSSN